MSLEDVIYITPGITCPGGFLGKGGPHGNFKGRTEEVLVLKFTALTNA
jgi:hypothetical protein